MALQNTTNLKEFNTNSAKRASFPGTIFNGKVHMYDYEAKTAKKTVTAHKFECTLVGQDAHHYVKAFLKGSENDAKSAHKKYTDGSRWILSKASLDTWTKSAYISTPLQFRINLEKTTMKKVEGAVQEMPLEPIPPRTIAETIGITTDKAQDILCLVKHTKDRRKIPDGTVLTDALLVDGSTRTPKPPGSASQPAGDDATTPLFRNYMSLSGVK